MLGVDVKPKIEGGEGRRGGFSKPKPPAFKGPTPGLEKVFFNYGVGKGAADFEVYMEMVAEWMGMHIKYSAGQVSKAIHTGFLQLLSFQPLLRVGTGFRELLRRRSFIAYSPRLLNKKTHGKKITRGFITSGMPTAPQP